MKKFIKNNLTNRSNGESQNIDLNENFPFQDFVDYSTIGIFQLNNDTVIEYANQSLAQILDYKSRTDLIGINFINDIISDSADWEKLRSKLYKHRIAKNFIIPLKQNSGASIFVRVDIRAASDKKGNPIYFEGSVTDVSELVTNINRVNRELQAVQEEKVSVSPTIVSTSSGIDKSLSDAISKLKTPINSIVGFLTLIEQGLFNSEEELKDFSHKTRLSVSSLIEKVDGITKKFDQKNEAKHEEDIQTLKVDEPERIPEVGKITEEVENAEDEKEKPEENTEELDAENEGNYTKEESLEHNGKKILLVEDNPISQNVEMRLLKESGYSVVAVTNGNDAIEAVKTNKYSLVLMDVEMPDMDGINATKFIRQLDSQINQIPIIAVTAHSSMKDRERCLASGMNDYIAKPININFMKMTIDQWLKRNVAI